MVRAMPTKWHLAGQTPDLSGAGAADLVSCQPRSAATARRGTIMVSTLAPRRFTTQLHPVPGASDVLAPVFVLAPSYARLRSAGWSTAASGRSPSRASGLDAVPARPRGSPWG